MPILVKGAGVAGLTVAHELWSRGHDVAVFDPAGDHRHAASWYAGGMLAPYCERESAEQAVVDLGAGAADWWDAALPGLVRRNGTLVVAPARDTGELRRFAGRTTGFEPVDHAKIAALEPDLAENFRGGLFFGQEAHLDPRSALMQLRTKLAAAGVEFHAAAPDVAAYDRTVDCSGMAARLSGLRGVRGEMLLLRTAELSLARPVRLIHPRFPLYIVPRDDNMFMVGATMIESEQSGPIRARSLMELLNAAYALHPAFGEAELVETGVGIRPAYADNLPRVSRDGATTHINGLYRHGFLLAPAMAVRAAGLIENEEEP
jgi:glycine oxidase